MKMSEKIKCVCGKEIDGSLVFVDVRIEPSDIPMCETCLNLAANQEWGKLTERVHAAVGAREIIEMRTGEKQRGVKAGR